MLTKEKPKIGIHFNSDEQTKFMIKNVASLKGITQGEFISNTMRDMCIAFLRANNSIESIKQQFESIYLKDWE